MTGHRDVESGRMSPAKRHRPEMDSPRLVMPDSDKVPTSLRHRPARFFGMPLRCFSLSELEYLTVGVEMEHML